MSTNLQVETVTVRTFDGNELIVPIETILQSNLIRNLLDEGCHGTIELIHESCTFDVLSFIFNMITVSEENSADSVHYFDSEMVFKAFHAAIYLDMDAILCKFSRVRDLLHLMSVKGCPDAVKALIELKADINERNSDGKTALDLAKDEGCLQELESARLIQRGYTPFLVHAYHGKTENMLALFNSMDDKVACLNSREPGRNRTALHIACRNGHAGTALALLHANADIHALSDDKMPALHLAAGYGHADVVALLLDAKARVHAQPNHLTPLHLAAQHGHIHAAQVLLTSRADANARAVTYSCWWCERDVTPLHLAVSVGCTSAVAFLLDARASPSAVKYGHCGNDLTPLHVAAQRGDAATARLLLAAKADPNAAADLSFSEMAWYGCASVTPLHLACCNSYGSWAKPESAGPDGPAGVVRALLEARADARAALVDSRGRREGWTALQCATEAARAGGGSARTAEAVNALLAGLLAGTRRSYRKAAARDAPAEGGGGGDRPDTRGERRWQLWEGRRAARGGIWGGGGGVAAGPRRARRAARKGRRGGRRAGPGQMSLLWGWAAEE